MAGGTSGEQPWDGACCVVSSTDVDNISLPCAVKGLYRAKICALPLVGGTVRAMGLGYGTKESRSGAIGGRRLTSAMVESLPAPYVERWMATGCCTGLSVLLA